MKPTANGPDTTANDEVPTQTIQADPPINCSTCPCFVMSSDLRTGNCHADPPQAFIFPGPVGLDGQPNFITRSIWRPVLPSEWCARHPRFGMKADVAPRVATDNSVSSQEQE